MCKVKKIIVSVMVLIMFSVSTVGSFASTSDKEDKKITKVKLKSNMDKKKVKYVGDAIFEHELEVKVLTASIVVDVTSPCDEEWRSKYPSTWAYEANRAVERADDDLITEFGINFLSVAQPIWNSSNTTSGGLLTEAYSEHGLTYNSSKTADIMIAFSGVTPSDNSNTTGIGFVGTPGCVIFDNGYSTNAETVQHEVGHNYGLNHCQDETGSEYGDSDCVMTEVGFGYIGEFCTGHHDEWEDNKYKY